MLAPLVSFERNHILAMLSKTSRRRRRTQATNTWGLAVLFVKTFFSTTQISALDFGLLERAASVRSKIQEYPQNTDLFYPSAYPRPDGKGMRGMCNWVIPNRLMVGQYPGQSPEPFAPNSNDVQSHIQSLTKDAGINLFCSLQSEIPAQSDKKAWEFNGGERYFPDPYVRREFPRPFKHYAPIVESFNPDVKFIHAPIDDCDVPKSDGALSDLLMDLLTAMDEEDRCIYVHCWGGRGRAGLVGACLLSLIFPEKDAASILELIQIGYDTRAGAKNMPPGLQQSPQTQSQKDFVKLFVEERQRHHFFFKKENVVTKELALE